MGWEAFIDKALWAMIGAIVSLCGAYVALGRSVEFIKGQLTQVLEVVRDYPQLRQSHVLLARDYENHKRQTAADGVHENSGPPGSFQQ